MSDSERTVIAPRSAAGVAIGARLNGIYEIERLIAVGGMGEVYKGRAIQTGDAVAIKMIRPDMAQNENALALFRKEAAALHNLYHEAIVRYYVFTVDPETQSPYLAMEFVDGQPLSDRLKQGPLSFEEVDMLRRRIAAGLHAAHQLGIVHRDVSPDNIILPGGQVARAKIIDFGIARSTQLGEGTVIGSGFAGKYNYVSPEQLGLGDGNVTGRSDIYSLGLVLAEAIGGRALDMGGTQLQILDKRRRVPDLTAIDARIRALLARMLAPDPMQRPADMAAVASWQPAAPAVAARGGSPLRAVAAVAVAALLAGGGYLAWTMTRTPPVPVAAPPPPLSEQPGQTAVLTPPRQDSVPQPAEPPAPPRPALPPPAPLPAVPPAPSLAAPPPAAAPPQRIDPPSQPAPPALSVPPPAPAPAPPPATASATQIETPRLTSPPPPTLEPPARPTPEPPRVETPPRPAPPTATAVVREPPPARTDGEPRNPVERIERYVSGYDGGACFFLWPLELAGRKADLEGFGSGAEPFVAFDAAFKAAQGFEAQINLRPVTAAQCPMVDFLRQNSQRIDRSPRLQIGAFNMKSGDVLSGHVESPADQHLDVVLIGDDGLVYNLSSYVRREGSRATFSLKLESTGTTPRPQTVLALVSATPYPALGGANPAPASEFFASLAGDVARSGARLGLGIKYFRIQ